MFAHERSLVTKNKERPFILLGVNEDTSLAGLSQAQEEHHLNWRSWWDGRDNAIADEWKVKGWPSLFLVDHKGMVRWRHDGPPENAHLEELIEQLVQEAEKETRKQVALNKR